jgi:AraC family transcriptional regulator, regulatory protein of adaptative response / methylated-DNA-[protein]-cysteine methyltransferase
MNTMLEPATRPALEVGSSGRYPSVNVVDDRWHIVAARDPLGTATFVYGVRSTSVYCRPSCPARRPAPEQVLFFPTARAATRAGFRPCLRCRPELGGGLQPQLEKIHRVCGLLEGRPGTGSRLSDLAREVGWSPYHLQRTFKRIVGVSPKQYARSLRMERMRSALRARRSVRRAAYESGYRSVSWLYAPPHGQLGMDASAYKAGAAGIHIRFAITSTPLGMLLVAGTDRGVCAVRFGAPQDELVGELQREFPRAEISPDNGSTVTEWSDLLQKVVIAPPSGNWEVPLHIRGTAFQARVWQAIRTIERGRTASYSEIARTIGKPRAARAVARACATNPVALAVPCHRVVRKDGTAAGYRWGLARQQRLLRDETVAGTP